MDNMGEFSSFIVNGKTYNVRNLSVIEALSFHLEFVHSMVGFLGSAASLLLDSGLTTGKGKKGAETRKITPEMIAGVLGQLKPEEANKLIEKVLKRVITPEQMLLDNQASIQDWFGRAENAPDLWPVVFNGMFALLGEYLPSTIRTAVLGFQQVAAGLSTLNPNNKSMPLSEK